MKGKRLINFKKRNPHSNFLQDQVGTSVFLPEFDTQNNRDQIVGHPYMRVTHAFADLPTEMVFKILANLDTSSLLSCRQVSGSLCEVSSKILQNRPTVYARPMILNDPKWKSSFVDLVKCFKQSRKFGRTFPYGHFVITEVDVESPDLKSFFALSKQSRIGQGSDSGSDHHNGLLIKGLHLNMIKSSHTMAKMETLIFKATPHLKILVLEFYPINLAEHCFDQNPENYWKNQNSDEESTTTSERTTKLLSLEVLQMYNCTGFVGLITEILRAAPNLRRIEGVGRGLGSQGKLYDVYHPHHLIPLINAKKLHLVRKCTISFYWPLVHSGIMRPGKLSGFQPTILELRLDRYDESDNCNLEDTKSAMRDLMWTVKDAVEEWWIETVVDLLHEINDLPKLSKLRQLRWNLQS